MSSATLAALFRPPPVECLRSENLLIGLALVRASAKTQPGIEKCLLQTDQRCVVRTKRLTVPAQRVKAKEQRRNFHRIRQRIQEKKTEISPTKNAGVWIPPGQLRTKTIYRKFPDIAEAQERVRATQWVLNTSTTITDAAFLVFLGTPRCPHRVKNDLRFSHMMHRKSIGEEKQGAENYAHPKIERGNDGPKLNCSAPAPHRE